MKKRERNKGRMRVRETERESERVRKGNKESMWGRKEEIIRANDKH